MIPRTAAGSDAPGFGIPVRHCTGRRTASRAEAGSPRSHRCPATAAVQCRRAPLEKVKAP